MNLPKVPHDFVIVHSVSKTYFRKMDGAKPVFGPGLPDAQKFNDEDAARVALSKFPSVARVLCDVTPRRK